MTEQRFELLEGPITGVRRLTAERPYVVACEVRVKAGAMLAAEDGTTILIQNGTRRSGTLRRAALIFEPGSRLQAGRLFLKGCNDRFRAVRVADNGGVWFCGTHHPATKDGLVVAPAPHVAPSAFSADLIAGHYLGHGDPQNGKDDPRQDDRDGVSLMGVGPQEWTVREVRSYHSGDDGFDLTNSQVSLERLRVVSPAEDGLNLSSSSLHITRSATVDVALTSVPDRDIFDLETDDGPSEVVLARHCHVDIRGVFGDQLTLTAQDMPLPTYDATTPYAFRGFLRVAPARIFSLDDD